MEVQLKKEIDNLEESDFISYRIKMYSKEYIESLESKVIYEKK